MTSSLKRRKLRKLELEEIKAKLKDDLPILNKRQIRRHRVPFDEALCLELQEDGFSETAAYIQNLVSHQESLRQKYGVDTHVWHEQQLKNNKEILLILYDGLKEAEIYKQEDKVFMEIDELMELAISFTESEPAWWWVAEQLFMQTLHISNDYSADGYHRNAIAYYFYGRFLLKKLKRVEDAEIQLRKCRELCAGHKWMATDFLRNKEKYYFHLHKDCCILLYEAMLIIAQHTMKTDPQSAVKMCTCAVKRAVEAEDLKGEAECLFQLGVCEMKANNLPEAIKKFHKVLIMYFSCKNLTGIGETRIHLGAAHFKNNAIRDAKYQMTQLQEFSIKYELKYYEAHANRLLGEIELHTYCPFEATQHLLKALELFHELDDYNNREQSKNLAAVAAGLQLMIQYRNLIQSCAQKNSKQAMLSLMKIVRWKDIREVFWELVSQQSIKQATASVTTEESFEGEDSYHWSDDLKMIKMIDFDDDEMMQLVSEKN